MRLRDEFEVRECYEVEPGCPTLTVVWLSKQTMIPWSRFTSGEFTPDNLTLQFGAKTSVVIRGKNLEEIWRAAQMQDLRLIRPSKESDNGKCRILSLVIEVPKEDDTEDDIPF